MYLFSSLVEYFNLRSGIQVKSPNAPRDSQLHLIIPQYIAVVLGILVQPFFSSYQQTGQWLFNDVLGRLAFSVIVGIVILPGVYKSSFDPDKPIFIQLCLLFVAGMGWESLLSTALAATT